MDMNYKTFATRSSRNARFNQLCQVSTIQQPANSSAVLTSQTPTLTAPLSPRKRVNVVSFSSQNEKSDTLSIDPPPHEPQKSDRASKRPPSPLIGDVTTRCQKLAKPLVPTSNNSSDPLTQSLPAGRKEFRSTLTPTSIGVPGNEKSLFTPKFKRVCNAKSHGHTVDPTTRNGIAFKTASPTNKPCLSTNLSAPVDAFPQRKLVTISASNSTASNKDPYEWEEEEKPEKEDEEEDDDDGIKPWFWPAAREPTKPAITSIPSTTTTKPLTTRTDVVVEHKNNKLLVPRDQKSLFTVVQNVKEAYECQERGGVQHALDDMTYLIDGFADTNNNTTRSLSILTLANKCLSSATRDLIHAYGLLKQISANLHDAHTDYALGLTAAGLFFVLSRDRDPDILSAESLSILLKLLHAPNTIAEKNADSTTSVVGGKINPAPPLPASKYSSFGAASRQSRLNKEASQIRSKVQQLLESVCKQQHKRSVKSGDATPVKSPPPAVAGTVAALFAKRKPVSAIFPGLSGSVSTGVLLNARHLRMNRQLTARDLALEALLNLGTRKARLWFKTDIRTGGGIDEVGEVTIDAVDYLQDLPSSCFSGCDLLARNNPTGLDDFSLDKLRHLNYYSKLLENMTYMNPDNQTHLVRFKERRLIDRLVQCIHLCASRLPRHSAPSVAWSELQAASAVAIPSTSQPTTTSSTVSTSALVVAELQPDQEILLSCLLGIFRLFVNISHNEYASDRLGGCPGLLEATLDCLFHLPDRLPPSRRFDLLVLILCLLANLCEHCPENRIRIVHLEVLTEKQEISTYTDDSSHSAAAAVKLDDVDYDDEEEDLDAKKISVSVLDEIVKLFLYREAKALAHDFERDDDDPPKVSATSNSSSTAEADSTTTTASGVLHRPKPPPSLLTSQDEDVSGAVVSGETIEEAGLKWRLIGASRKGSGGATNSLAARSRASRSKKSRRRAHRRKRRLAFLRNHKLPSDTNSKQNSESEDEDDEEDEEEEDENEGSDEEEESEEEEEECQEEEDDEMGGGADVEFVAETAEEQAKLAERMSSANQHMEDSVVAAYAALLLGCILQSSPRYAERIRARLPDGKFRPLAIMLAKLLSFLSLARGVESAGSESILHIVRTLEAQDQPPPSNSVGSSSSTPSLSFPTTRLAASSSRNDLLH